MSDDAGDEETMRQVSDKLAEKHQRLLGRTDEIVREEYAALSGRPVQSSSGSGRPGSD